jgi:hypothetical protein
LLQRVLLITAAVLLVGLTFRLDRRVANNLFPRDAVSLNAPIGLALWILSLQGMTQTSVTLFLPLLLQVVHQVSPVVINFLSIVISMGWTTGTFTVSGWSGKRRRARQGPRAQSPYPRFRTVARIQTRTNTGTRFQQRGSRYRASAGCSGVAGHYRRRHMLGGVAQPIGHGPRRPGSGPTTQSFVSRSRRSNPPHRCA